MIPPKRITDPTFRYVNAANTDIAKTFARIRREMREAKPAAYKVTSSNDKEFPVGSLIQIDEKLLRRAK